MRDIRGIAGNDGTLAGLTTEPGEVREVATPSEDATWPVNDKGHIPSLDGLRAVAITAVLIGHLSGTANYPQILSDLVKNSWVNFANVGVRTFLVISGFLITYLLMAEYRRRGGISLRHFFLRRSVRIFPAYYAYLGALVVLTVGGVIHLTTGDFAHAFTFTVNYQVGSSWQVGHLWSIALQEQFYLLWPVAIVLLGLARAHWAAIAVVVAAPVSRALSYDPLHPLWWGGTFQNTADVLALGCLLALSGGYLLKARWFRLAVDSKLLIAALFVVATILRRQGGMMNPLVAYTLMNFTIALMVAHVVLHWQGAAGWFLNLRPIVYIGALSYSLYLWHMLFFNGRSDAVFTSFPLNVALVAVFTLGSYYLVERPSVRIRPRVEARVLGKRPAGAGEVQKSGVAPEQVAANDGGEERTQEEVRSRA